MTTKTKGPSTPGLDKTAHMDFLEVAKLLIHQKAGTGMTP